MEGTAYREFDRDMQVRKPEKGIPSKHPSEKQDVDQFWIKHFIIASRELCVLSPIMNSWVLPHEMLRDANPHISFSTVA